ncbi:MAG: ribonuclease HII [Eggerthellaceae bacterium]|nr:ribonuclease HII [Eggerthellaceae bacterium]
MDSKASDIIARIKSADETEFEAMRRALAADTRRSVIDALNKKEKRIAALRAEEARVRSLYDCQNTIAKNRLVVGLDEVGRGPVAGPLAIGAVVLNSEPIIMGINDSKQLSAKKREELSEVIKQKALASCVVFIEPEEIDELGMSACLRKGFSSALRQIEDTGIHPEVVLIDGNPLHIDPREINVVKGDARCASIAAASIIAKVERDKLMDECASLYPAYGFESNKGYASEQHINAIVEQGLSPIHRKTFCTSFLDAARQTRLPI